MEDSEWLAVARAKVSTNADVAEIICPGAVTVTLLIATATAYDVDAVYRQRRVPGGADKDRRRDRVGAAGRGVLARRDDQRRRRQVGREQAPSGSERPETRSKAQAAA